MHIVTTFYYNHPKLTLCYFIVSSHACFSNNYISDFIKHLRKPLLYLLQYLIFYVIGDSILLISDVLHFL